MLLLQSARSSVQPRRVFMSCFGDDGEAWSRAKRITARVKLTRWTWYATGPGRGPGIQIAGPPACSCLVAQPGGAAGRPYERGEESRYESIVFTRVTVDAVGR